ncbi:MAG: reverse gyrase [Desulfurococcales archaeon ex4484_58]|nr:MAG: reverse gyrase [Desulfurococcales archaeon ex4484_58]
MVDLNHIHGIYRYACPNCGRENSDLRLSYKAPCPNCLREEVFKDIKKTYGDLSYTSIVERYYQALKREGSLKKYSELYSSVKRVVDFEKFFGKITGGYKLWSAQKTWASRLLKNRSFSIVAPTGTGKTMFILTSALYLARKRKNSKEKIYIVFPTTPLLIQAYNKLLNLARNSGIQICNEEELGSDDCLTILAIHGKLSKSKREEYIKLIEEGRFDILLSTNMFMHKNYELLLGKTYKLIVMDDVDAILRSGKAIRILFKILGVNDQELDSALEYLKLRQRLAMRLSEEERLEIEKKIVELDKYIKNIRDKIKTIVIVSSATGKPRGIYPKLFRILLGFEVGSRAEAIRNIVDTYILPKDSIDKTLIDLVKKLGDGGLVFVPLDKGIEYAEKIAELLRNTGFKAEAFYAGKALDIFNRFASGEIDLLVGVATYYGVMVRGLDLPERVKYAIFTGVPRHKFSSKLESPKPSDILRILTILRDVAEGDEKREVELMIGRLTSRFRRLSQGAMNKLREDLLKKLSGEEVEEYPLLNMLIQALDKTRELLSKPEIWNKLREKGDIALVRENGKDYLLIPDVATYIQASGRTSRLYPGGITKGLSVIIVDDQRLLNGLKKRMKWIYEEFDIKPLKEIDIDKLIREINEERIKVKKILSGEIEVEKTLELTKTALLIVESPNKARTIANFFGKPSTRLIGDKLMVYDVATGEYVLSIIASIGHVYDLVVDKGIYNYGVDKINGLFIPIYTDIKKCNSCGYQFTEEKNHCPKCGSRDISRKLDIVNILRELATEVDVVLIGTDPDTEGEKIGWDLKVLLEPYAKSIKRIEFHEVTRRAILEAIRKPRDFDLSLVEAQIVRRVEDRWLGFALSKIAQKYFWTDYCFNILHGRLMYLLKKGSKLEELPSCCEENRNFSAGRVQTPVLGYIIEREREKQDRDKWRYYIVINVNDSKLRVEIDRGTYEKLSSLQEKGLEIKALLEEVEKKKEIVNPPPPYTTDTLLEEASMKLGLSTTRVMEIAQDLFELGLITYHRTDSTRVSDAGIAVARAYLEEKYGPRLSLYFKPRTWGAGGAHECIRPTKPIDPDRLRELIKEGILVLVKPLTRQHYEVYRLIFERFIASQMIPAQVIKQKLVVSLNGFRGDVERIIDIVEKGFTEIYREYIVVEQPIKTGEYPVVKLGYYEPPLAKFHDVIKWMKTQGIGRPSTYAKIVQTLLDRRYVTLSRKQKALRPSDRGKIVYDYLMKFYRDIVSVEVTRRLEEKMKEIEEGKRNYQEVLNELFEELRTKIIENTEINKALESMWREYCGGVEV